MMACSMKKRTIKNYVFDEIEIKEIEDLDDSDAEISASVKNEIDRAVASRRRYQCCNVLTLLKVT